MPIFYFVCFDMKFFYSFMKTQAWLIDITLEHILLTLCGLFPPTTYKMVLLGLYIFHDWGDITTEYTR